MGTGTKYVTLAVALVVSTMISCGPYAPTAPTKGERELAAQIYDDVGNVRKDPPSTWPAGTSFENAKATVDQDGHNAPKPFVPPFYRSANAYCANLQRQATRAANRYDGWGWAFGITGLVGTGASRRLPRSRARPASRIRAGKRSLVGERLSPQGSSPRGSTSSREARPRTRSLAKLHEALKARPTTGTSASRLALTGRRGTRQRPRSRATLSRGTRIASSEWGMRARSPPPRTLAVRARRTPRPQLHPDS